MAVNLIKFWTKISDSAYVHPADQDVWTRVSHHFERDCLPKAFTGRILTAPVVLLFLSPGYSAFDSKHAQTAEGRKYYRRQRSGRGLLPTPEEHEHGYKWLKRVLKQFDFESEEVRDKIAILNIGAYHSRSFQDAPMLTALPSSRLSLDWAQSVLFPQAERGDRVVVCLRAAPRWGLERGKRYGKSLFAPETTRGGVMRRGRVRDEAIRAVRSKAGA